MTDLAEKKNYMDISQHLKKQSTLLFKNKTTRIKIKVSKGQNAKDVITLKFFFNKKNWYPLILTLGP